MHTSIPMAKANICCLRLDRSNYWIGWQFFIVNLNLCLCARNAYPLPVSLFAHQIWQMLAILFAPVDCTCIAIIKWYTLVSLEAITFHLPKHITNRGFVIQKMVTSNVNIFMTMLCIWMMIDTLLKIYSLSHRYSGRRKEKDENKRERNSCVQFFKSIFMCAAIHAKKKQRGTNTHFEMDASNRKLPNREHHCNIDRERCQLFVSVRIKKSSSYLIPFSDSFQCVCQVHRSRWKKNRFNLKAFANVMTQNITLMTRKKNRFHIVCRFPLSSWTFNWMIVWYRE